MYDFTTYEKVAGREIELNWIIEPYNRWAHMHEGEFKITLTSIFDVEADEEDALEAYTDKFLLDCEENAVERFMESYEEEIDYKDCVVGLE